VLARDVRTSEVGLETAFTQLAGCRHPPQQAYKGGAAVPSWPGRLPGPAPGMLCEFGIEAAAGH